VDRGHEGVMVEDAAGDATSLVSRSTSTVSTPGTALTSTVIAARQCPQLMSGTE
jgi:hypothetical protein